MYLSVETSEIIVRRVMNGKLSIQLWWVKSKNYRHERKPIFTDVILSIGIDEFVDVLGFTNCDFSI